VAEVMKHYGSADDIALSANLGFVLLDKEERKGLAAFSQAERYVYAVQGMMREVNNGGWSQFFFNSAGELAPLAPALEDEFYENPEDLDALLLRFIAERPAEFSS
jgi:hypothetical protein